MKARLIRADGSSEPADIPSRSARWYAIVPLVIMAEAPGRPGLAMWDSGGVSPHRNIHASVLAEQLTQPVPTVERWLTGDVIVTGGLAPDGRPMPLTDIQDLVIAEMCAALSRRITFA